MDIEKIKNIFKKIMEYIFKTRCVFCQNISSNFLCMNCKTKYNKLFNVVYLKHDVIDKDFMTCSLYAEDIKWIIRNIKYNNKLYYIYVFLEFVKDDLDLIDLFNNIDYITYIPSDKETIRDRGYNQAKEIALIFGKYFQKPIKRFCIKNPKSVKQEGLNKIKRYENSRDMFECIVEKVEGNVLIIDDIYTSGATTYAMQKFIKRYNPKCRTYIFTLAYNISKIK